MDKEEFLSDEEYQGKLREQEKIRECCERIIKRYYNPQNIVLTEEDYRVLSKGVRRDDTNAEKALREKATFNAYNIVADMFVKGEIRGDFEDALQNTYLFMRGADVGRLSSLKTLRSFNNFSRLFLERSFERLGKSTDLYKKCEKVKLSEVDKIFQEEFLTGVLKRCGESALRKECAKLSEREQFVLREIYWEDRSLSQIAREENHSTTAIYYVRKNAIKKLIQPPTGRVLYEIYYEQ